MRRLILLSSLAVSSACFSDPPSTTSGADDEGTTGGSPTSSTAAEDDDDDEDESSGEEGSSGEGTTGETGLGGTTTGGEDESTGDEPEEDGVDLFERACEAQWIDTNVGSVQCPTPEPVGTPNSVLTFDGFDLPPPAEGVAPALVLQPLGGEQQLIQANWVVGPDWGMLGSPTFLAEGVCITSPPAQDCSLEVQLRLFRDDEALVTGVVPLNNGPASPIEYNFNNEPLLPGDEVVLVIFNMTDDLSNEAAALIEPRIVFD